MMLYDIRLTMGRIIDKVQEEMGKSDELKPSDVEQLAEAIDSLAFHVSEIEERVRSLEDNFSNFRSS